MIELSQITLLLQNLGLSKREAEVYLTLLELNEALPSTLAKKLGQKRPTCYLTLEKLQTRGLASSVKKKGVLYYQATKPDRFLEIERSRAQQLEKTLSSLTSALPELLSLHQKYSATPQMSVFYGKEGLIQVMEDTLTSKTELLCWCNGDLALESLKEYYPEYLRRKIKKNLWLKGVSTYDKASLHDKKYGAKELREVYLIPKEEYPIQNEINIYDDKVAIISHTDEIGVIIQNEHIANTQRAIFKLTFERAKELEKKVLTEEDIKYLKGKSKS